MESEGPKDPFKGVDWKAIGSELQKDPSAATKPVVKKRLPRKIRQIPECYFLPRIPLPKALAFYGACIAGGVGAGMLLEVWINKKVEGVAALNRSYYCFLPRVEALYGSLTNKAWTITGVLQWVAIFLLAFASFKGLSYWTIDSQGNRVKRLCSCAWYAGGLALSFKIVLHLF